MDSFNLSNPHQLLRLNFSYVRKEKIVAKLTQSLSGLLFFCNLLFPEKSQEKGEQNTNK
jgi:hypothetical protein